MGLIEIEFDRQQFVFLATYLVRSSPIPDPTFEVLGKDRLIRSFDCTNVSFDNVPPDLAAPPGVLAAKMDVSIGHASVAELEANADAQTTTEATGWIFLSVIPIPLKQNFVDPPWSKQTYLIADLIRLDVPGQPVTKRFDDPASPRFGRQPLGKLPISLPDIFDNMTRTGTAVLLTSDTATLRMATNGDDVFAPPGERLVALNKEQQEANQWLVRVSPGVFTDVLLEKMQESAASPPDGAEVIAQPTVDWVDTAITWPGGPPPLSPLPPDWPLGANGLPADALPGWAAAANFRLAKHKACGDNDVDLTIFATLLPVPDDTTSTVNVYLEVSAQADDDSTFKCWLNTVGAVSLAGFFVLPDLAIGAGLAGFTIIGDTIGSDVGQGVTGQSTPAGFDVQGSGDNFCIYSMSINLDLGDLKKVGAQIQFAQARQDGVVFAGTASLLVLAAGIEHQCTFDPGAGSTLVGTWASGYDCSSGWHAAFELQRVHITDEIVFGKQQLGAANVAAFDTSWVVPPTHWSIEHSPTAVDQFVSIVGDQWAYTSPFTTFPHPPPTAGHAFLHTSAGIARYEIAHVPRPPSPPGEAQLAALKVNCMRLIARLQNIEWLVDPPDFNYGHDPLRQWMVEIDQMPAYTQLELLGVRDGASSRRLGVVTADGTGRVNIEIVTDAKTELRIEHNLDQPIDGARISQQWLLPTTTVALAGRATELQRIGDRIVARPPATVVSISAGSVGRRPAGTAMPPASVVLPDGRIAAVHADKLVLAYPFGGAAVHAPSVGSHPAQPVP
jgi:hypothetical protein